MEKLLKLLNLSGSANDNEALVAMRKAQSLMKDMGISWDMLLNKGYQPPAPPKAPPPQQPWGYTGRSDSKMDRLQNFRMPFGKHKGRTLADLYEADKQYLEWAYNNMENRAGDTIREFMDL